MKYIKIRGSRKIVIMVTVRGSQTFIKKEDDFKHRNTKENCSLTVNIVTTGYKLHQQNENDESSSTQIET